MVMSPRKELVLMEQWAQQADMIVLENWHGIQEQKRRRGLGEYL